ncbi:hypothetical protein MA16_Dca001498 [Dendrobium catenatum]|uniref:Uncharacterized protein n=1 Tax=Dendrobium catenatum TaxID=906689 RepID=A0A2I0WMK0_9ASPA|nr:hypothetical protein MA16_Dca001498 [Dendrobium catenatum]
MALSCSVATRYPSVYPLRRSSCAAVLSAGCHPTTGYSAQLFVPEVVKAVDSLYSDFREVDNLVAHNATRVLKAFQNARVGSHASIVLLELLPYDLCLRLCVKAEIS